MIQPLLIPTAAEKRIDTDFYVEGYATTFDKPYLLYEWDGNKYYERIDRNALAGADMSDVIMQYNHEGKVLAHHRRFVRRRPGHRVRQIGRAHV